MSFKAPFPYFGGKSRAASLIWSRLGNPSHYIEPCGGSMGVLLGRPGWSPNVLWMETFNDTDGLLCNFWRAMTQDPESVIDAADYPPMEIDLHVRHAELIRIAPDLTQKLVSDPDWFDAKLAGWWVWGRGLWIGSGWGYQNNIQVPGYGLGIHRVKSTRREILREIAVRLSRVRVLCGDWSRAVGSSGTTTWRNGDVAIFFDPPYGEGSMDYANGGNENKKVASDIWEWAKKSWQKSNQSTRTPEIRICVAGYEDGREVPPGWFTVDWEPRGGYGLQGNGQGRLNAQRERLWFSPNCLTPEDDSWLLGE